MLRKIQVAICALICGHALAQPQISQQALDNFDQSQTPSVDHGTAMDINNQNVVAGYYEFGGQDNTKPYVWRNSIWPGGRTMALLPDLTGLASGYGRANAIQNGPNPTVVGRQRNGSGVFRAAKWVTSDGVTYGCSDIQNAPFNWDGMATGINDSGVIVGFGSVGPAGPFHAFRYTTVGGMTSLFHPVNDTRESRASAVNSSGRICGYVDVSPINADNKAFYFDGMIHDLPQNFGGPYTSSEAIGINANHDIVGRVRNTVGWRACMWEWNGISYNNPVLVADYGSVARDINDIGAIVGASSGRAFLYDDGTLFDLTTLPIGGYAGTITDLTSINDKTVSGMRFYAMTGTGLLPPGHFQSIIGRYAKGDPEMEPVHGAIGSVSFSAGTMNAGESLTGTYTYTYRDTAAGTPDADGRGSAGTVTIEINPSSGMSIDSYGASHTYTVAADESSMTFELRNIGWEAYGQSIELYASSAGYFDGYAAITVNNPAPALTALSPTSATAGGSTFTLVVTGSGFSPQSKIRWNGAQLTTTAVSSTELSAVIPSWRIASAGTASIDVYSPAPGGGTTTPISFPIYGQLTGRVSLASLAVSSAGQLVDIEIRNVGSLTPLVTRTVTLDASASYTCPVTLSGTYDITAKGSHWLRKKRSSQVLGSVSTSGVNFSLKNGDCNGDNIVDIADYAMLSSAYGTFPGDAGWDPAADLNADEGVDIGDYAVLSANWLEEGDE